MPFGIILVLFVGLGLIVSAFALSGAFRRTTVGREQTMYFGLVAMLMLGLSFALLGMAILQASGGYDRLSAFGGGCIISVAFVAALIAGLIGIIRDEIKWPAVVVTIISGIIVLLSIITRK
jgi:hypothetical protein